VNANPIPYQSFLDYLKFEKRYSVHTIRSYQDDLIQFFDFLATTYGAVSIKEITAPILRSWFAQLREQGITARSIRRKMSTLKSFFKFQIKQGELKQSPMTTVTTPKIGKRLPDFVPQEDMELLLQSIEATEDWKGMNAKLLFQLFYNTGMRLSELVQLKDRQIDAAKAVVKILGKGNKERVVPISTDLVKLIQGYQQERDRLFERKTDRFLVTEKGQGLYPKYAYLIINHYLKSVKTLDQKSPHTLRHSFATHLTNNGASINAVKELLGHSSLAATQVYTHNNIDKLMEVFKKAHPREQQSD